MTAKLIIQIPCYNEEQTLGVTLKALPRQVNGVDAVEWLVVDDGSTDRTVQVATEHGVDHVVRLTSHQGLARAFSAGIDACLRNGADVIVNTDADNQYRGEDIEKLVAPILAGKSDIVIGARPIEDVDHFSRTKVVLQKIGSWVVRKISNTNVQDAPSGFRAMSRDAAMRLNVFSDYSYTLEQIIQAGQKNMLVTSVPVGVNPELRPSRLVKSMFNYVARSATTIIRIFITYRPLRFFLYLGGTLFLLGFLIGVRFLFYYLSGQTGGHIQSLILASLLMGIGFQFVVVGVLADLIAVNRKLLEQIDWQLKQRQEHND